MEKIIHVDSEERIDIYISLTTKKSRTHTQKLIKEGYVTVNDKVIRKPSFTVTVNDEIKIIEPEPEPINLIPENKPLKIVYEDKALLIIDKEAGLLVHPTGSKTTNTLVNRLLFHIKDLQGINGNLRPGIVHRLDKDTSGLMVVVKNEEAFQKLVELFKQHQIKRKYIALVKGAFTKKEGIIDLPLRRREGEAKMRVAISGKRAVTHFKVIEEIGPYSLITVSLETGRTHQIRAHFSHIGHPVVGDQLYGHREKDILLKRQFLHSYEICFIHPIIGKKIEAFSMLPEDLVDTLNDVRKRWKKK